MKKNELRFLLGLHDDIDKGCKILGVTRQEFMPNMSRFFDTVSLGIELGIQMKGKPASAAAEILGKSPKAKAAKVTTAPKIAGGPTMAERLAKVMGRRTMGITEVMEALQKAKLAPESNNLRAYVNTTLCTAKDGKGKKTFTSPERGMYFVTAKQSAREIVRKKKTAKKAAAKSKANGKSTKKSDAKSATAAATASTLN